VGGEGEVVGGEGESIAVNFVGRKRDGEGMRDQDGGREEGEAPAGRRTETKRNERP
jgi:hypothetical protein